VDRTAFTLYLVTLILSPILFGAVHTYAYTIMSLGVIIGSLLQVGSNIKRQIRTGGYQLQLPKTSLNFAFFALLTFLFFQVLPLPDFFLEVLSPEAMVAGKRSLPPAGTLISEGPIRHVFALSPYYYPVRMSIIRFTVYGLFFLGLTQLLNSQRRVEVTIVLILITGCFEALYGLGQAYSGSNQIWWFKRLADPRAVTGTYINRNHFAGFMELCLLVAAAYGGALSGRTRKKEIVSGHKPSVRVRLSRFLSAEQRFDKRTLILFSGVVIGIGLIFSASRGGLISAAGGLLCMSLLFILRKNSRKKGLVILFLFLITAAYALHIGVEYPVGRFEYIDIDMKVRARYTQKTMDMFDDYKWTGIGVGNFQYAYPKYQAPEDKRLFIRHAHCDWAQFLAEAGATGFCILLAGMSYYVYRTARMWRKRNDAFAICLGVAPLAALTAMAIHSYSDFNLHIPANCLMLVAIMAVGYSALHMERHRGRDKMLSGYYMIPLRYRGMLALVFVLGLIGWSGVWTVRHFMAEAYCNTVANSTLNRDQSPPLGEIKKAIAWDRWNAQYWFKRALELMRIRNAHIGDLGEDDQDRRNRQVEIIAALEEAVRLNPFRAECHLRLGWEYTYLWKDPDYHRRWLPAADISMDRAAYFSGVKGPHLHVELGNYWVMRSKTMYPGNPERETALAKARWHYRKAQEIDGSKVMSRRITQYIRNFYPDEEIVLEAVRP
jgi:hypothetical protein